MSVAVMFPVTSVRVAVVVTVKLAVVWPAGMDTVPGTVAFALVEAKAIVRPLAGAGLLMDTVPVEEAGPTTVLGLSARVVRVGAVTVRVAVGVCPNLLPDMVTCVFVETPTVVMVKVPLVLPAGTVTVAGTVATAVLLEAMLTVKPPVGAGLSMVRVPVEITPPSTEVGLTDMPVG